MSENIYHRRRRMYTDPADIGEQDGPGTPG